MTTRKPRLSNTNITMDSPILTTEDSFEAQDINSAFIRTVSGNIVGTFFQNYQSNDTLGTGEEDVADDGSNDEDQDNEKDPGDGSSAGSKLSPQLSDIEIISSTIEYDAAGNPTAKVVFKIKNSSGQELKSINTKVEVA